MFTTKNLLKIFSKHILIAFGFILIATISITILSGKIIQLSKTTAESRNMAASIREQASLLSSLKHEADIIGNNEEIIEGALIPSNNILTFVSAIESLALKNNISQKFHFSPPVVAPIGSPIPVNIINFQNSFSGNTNILVNYLKDFEKMPYFTQINSLNISSADGNVMTSANISFSASVYAKVTQ